MSFSGEQHIQQAPCLHAYPPSQKCQETGQQSIQAPDLIVFQENTTTCLEFCIRGFVSGIQNAKTFTYWHQVLMPGTSLVENQSPLYFGPILMSCKTYVQSGLSGNDWVPRDCLPNTLILQTLVPIELLHVQVSTSLEEV